MIATANIVERAIEFPEEQVREALLNFWAEEAMERADDPLAPVQQTKGTLYELLPALDSLTIVRSFVIIMRVLEMKVPVTLVKPGGYNHREEMLDDLLPKLRKLSEKRKS